MIKLLAVLPDLGPVSFWVNVQFEVLGAWKGANQLYLTPELRLELEKAAIKQFQASRRAPHS